MMKSKTDNFLMLCRRIIICVCAISALADTGWAWYSDQFEFRRKMSLDTSPLGADISENLSDVPVLVRLHSGNFDFTRVKVDGTDIRFVGQDDKTPLKYHIEKFDSLEELAFIWVRLPKIAGASNQDFIYIYYGNDAAADGQSPGQTYDGSFAGVYHLNETEGVPPDASSAGNSPSIFKAGQGFPGIIANGATFSGMGDHMVIPGSPTLNFKNGLTFSTWIRISAEQSDAVLLYQEAAGQIILVGLDGSKVYASVVDGKGSKSATDRSLDLPLGSWHQLTVAITPVERISLFLDGIEMGWAPMRFPLTDAQGDIVIGRGPDTNQYFSGDLDEIRISNTLRSSAMIRANYASEGPVGNLLSYGEEVTGGGGSSLPTFYLGAIMKNITADGWVVIGSLMILSVISWIIFLSKTYFIFLMERENRQFLTSFSENGNLLSHTEDDDDYQNSPLFKVYQGGADVLKKNLNGYEAKDKDECILKGETLSEKSLNAFKASLEKGFVMEGKRLNAGLLFLTMAISGGPFLGLLGTVWGVMNTFAAMAEAGEANIMAIAPGVASALATTVVGLIVAIPALFAYNYLAGKVKNLTSDLSVFIDEFCVKVDEQNGSV